VLVSARIRGFGLRVPYRRGGVLVEPLGVVHELDVGGHVLASPLDALAGTRASKSKTTAADSTSVRWLVD
jgi:hypothetical protein